METGDYFIREDVTLLKREINREKFNVSWRDKKDGGIGSS